MFSSQIVWNKRGLALEGFKGHLIRQQMASNEIICFFVLYRKNKTSSSASNRKGLFYLIQMSMMVKYIDKNLFIF